MRLGLRSAWLGAAHRLMGTGSKPWDGCSPSVAPPSRPARRAAAGQRADPTRKRKANSNLASCEQENLAGGPAPSDPLCAISPLRRSYPSAEHGDEVLARSRLGRRDDALRLNCGEGCCAFATVLEGFTVPKFFVEI